MNILITGASGFIGRHLAQRLLADGHRLTLCVHASLPEQKSPAIRTLSCDFTTDHRPEQWLDRVSGMDVVINSVGIIRESGARRFEALHLAAPTALFQACAQAGVKRVIQISALGADAEGEADGEGQAQYHQSKKRADDLLRSLPLEWAVVQPSLVYGEDGISAAMFRMLAGLPLMILPGGGGQMVQPVHIDDLAALVSTLAERRHFQCGTWIAAGPEPMTLQAYLQRLRQGMELPPNMALSIPAWWMRLMASVGDHIPASPLCSETWGMLQRGSTGDAHAFAETIGRAPLPVGQFIPRRDARRLRREAALAWITPLAVFSLAFLWLFSGIISISPWGVDESLRLLAAVGLTGGVAEVALYGAAALDICLGLALLYNRRMAWLWTLQIAVVCGYTAIIGLLLPEFLLHPYTPVVKNLPLICLMLLLNTLERS